MFLNLIVAGVSFFIFTLVNSFYTSRYKIPLKNMTN